MIGKKANRHYITNTTDANQNIGAAFCNNTNAASKLIYKNGLIDVHAVANAGNYALVSYLYAANMDCVCEGNRVVIEDTGNMYLVYAYNGTTTVHANNNTAIPVSCTSVTLCTRNGGGTIYAHDTIWEGATVPSVSGTNIEYSFRMQSGAMYSSDDGDRGDITVGGNGRTLTIDDNTIGLDEFSATGTASSSTYLRGDNTWAAAGSGAGLESATAAGATPVDSDVSAWANGDSGIVTGTGGRIWLAHKNATDVYYTELTAI